MALHWAKRRCKAIFVLSLVLIVISTGVEILGTFVYPSSWQDPPPDFDGTTHRFWDWSDNELTRCIVENRVHRALFGLASRSQRRCCRRWSCCRPPRRISPRHGSTRPSNPALGGMLDNSTRKVGPSGRPGSAVKGCRRYRGTLLGIRPRSG